MGKSENKETIKHRKGKLTMEGAAPISPVYLEYIKLTSFGAFANRVVGPFKPGLNVVYGPNEAGKTTVNQLVRGVMFGWPRARSQQNNYKPESAERVGSLFFTNSETRTTAELKRIKNTDDSTDDFGVLEDIDPNTYDTMFLLTSDELMDLRSHDEVTAHLLTAGSGTGASPAKAMQQIEQGISDLMSKSSQKPNSVPNLRAAEARLKERVRQGVDQSAAHLAEQQQLRDLQPRMDALSETQESLDEEIDKLRAARARLEQVDDDIAGTQQALEDAHAAEAEALDKARRAEPKDLQWLGALDDTELFRLTEGLDEQQSSLDRAEHALTIAQENEKTSRLEYEALAEDPGFKKQRESAARQRKIRLALTVFVALVMLGLFAVALLKLLDKPSITLLGAAGTLLIGSLFVCAAGFATNFRPSRVEDEMADRLKKAEWVMRQDSRMLEEAVKELYDQQAKTTAYLGANHLSQALGSVKHAREIVMQARQTNADKLANDQACKAIKLQISSLEEESRRLGRKRKELCVLYGLSPTASLTDFDVLIDGKISDRKRTINVASETSQRCGELRQKLQQALGNWDFDADKLELQRIRTCLKESERQLTTLLLAKISLRRAIADWEKVSQPEVYRKASELLELMTGGAWRQVFMDANGQIKVMDAVRTIRDPALLSMGTRQQLYLSLRIALLLTATAVGRHVPVMCDDILVNFDEKRRKGAVKALACLARSRQVILFTCHPDVVELVAHVEPAFNHIEL